MAFRLASCILLLLSLLFAVGAKEHVLTLDASNFDAEVAKHNFIVVEFYAPWCGHCQRLAPEYEKAAKILEETGVDVKLAKVDADNKKNKELAKRFGVQGFPTLKIFRKGIDTPDEFKGPRDASGIVNYLKKQAGPSTTYAKSAEQIEEVIESESIVIIGLFNDFDSEEFKNYSRVSSIFRSDYMFLHTADSSVLPEDGGALSSPGIRVFREFDEDPADTHDFEYEKLLAFIEKNTLPLVVEFTQDPKDRPFLSKIFESPKSKALLFFSYKLSDASDYRREFEAAAKSQPDNMYFVYGEESTNDHALKYFGVESSDTPVLIIHDPKADGKFLKKSIRPSEISDFLADFQAGKVDRVVKSEPIPEKNDGPVKVIVAKSLKDAVFESGKNVLLEFYAPWCGHCKKLEPVFNEVGKAFADNSEVVIAKMDATANDVPADTFDVKGFPTIYLYTKAGNAVRYEGDRSKSNIVEFVKKYMVAGDISKSEQQDIEDDAELDKEEAELVGELKDEL